MNKLMEVSRCAGLYAGLDCYLSFTGTHWSVDVALGSSRTRWENERERERG